MKTHFRLFLVGVVALAWILTPRLFAVADASTAGDRLQPPRSGGAIQPHATASILLRPALDLPIALPTATPEGLLFGLRPRALDANVVEGLRRLAPTPVPAAEPGALLPGAIVRPSKVIIGENLRYLEGVRRSDPERLSALGMTVSRVGVQDQLQVVDPERLRILSLVAADGVGSLGEEPPYVECNSAVDITTLGSILRGEVSEPGAPCAYSFTANGGAHYNLSVRSSDFVPWLDLFDPEGNYLEPVTDDPGEDGMSRYRSYVLPMDGAYTVIVRPVAEAATGGFVLTISPLSMMLMSANWCLRDIAVGQLLADETLLPRMKCYYEFTGAADSPVTIAMESTDGGFDPLLELNDPEGLREAANDDASPGDRDSLIQGHVLESDGTYVIVARAYDDTQGGQFNLSLLTGLPVPPTPTLCGGTIYYGQPINDTIRSVGGECRFEFTGASGDVVTIEMTRQDTRLDPFLTLVGPGVSPPKSDDDSAGNRNSRIRNYRLPQSGVFTIVAGSYQDRTSGSFTLSVRK